MNLDERTIHLDIPEDCDLDYKIQLELIKALMGIDNYFSLLKESEDE